MEANARNAYPSVGGVQSVHTQYGGGLAGTALEPIEANGTPVRDRIGNTESWLSDLHGALDRLEKRLDTILTPVPPQGGTAGPDGPRVSQPRSHVQGRLEILNEGFAHLSARLNQLHSRIEL